MKKLFHIVVLALCLTSTTAARDFAMRKAILDFVGDKAVTVKTSDSKGFDTDGPYKGARWQWTRYAFRLDEGNLKRLDELRAAYAADRESRNTQIAMMKEGEPLKFEIHYSAKSPAIEVGSTDRDINTMLISGTERKGVNTVIVMDWGVDTQAQADGPRRVAGNVYIIERDPRLAEGQVSTRQQQTEGTAARSDSADVLDQGFITPSYVDRLARQGGQYGKTSQNISRLQFFASKYVDAVEHDGGAVMVKASLLVVDKIIRIGTDDEKQQARVILDRMLAATPSPHLIRNADIRDDLKDNSHTLLNLLQRLDANSNVGHYDNTPHTFTLDGTIDEGLWDVGYYIYTSDESMEIKNGEPEVISVTGRTFFYQKELQDIRMGSVRALMKDGTVCSACIDMLFVPGEKAELSVHNGSYTLTGTGFYQQYSSTKNYIQTAIINHSMDRLTGNQTRQTFLDNIMLEVLSEHRNEPGVFYFIFRENRLSPNTEARKKAYDLLSDELKQSAYGVFFRQYLYKSWE